MSRGASEDEHAMSEPFYVTSAEITKVAGVHRRAILDAGEVVLELGVHGPIKEHFGLEDQPDLPLPVDYVVAAAGG